MALALWRGKRVQKGDIPHLEQTAATMEFGGGLDRIAAENKVYGDYHKAQAIEAAAHHYSGMKAARAVGAMDAAKSHAAGYQKAMKAAGLNHMGPTPPEVLAAAQKAKVVRFAPHSFDEALHE